MIDTTRQMAEEKLRQIYATVMMEVLIQNMRDEIEAYKKSNVYDLSFANVPHDVLHKTDYLQDLIFSMIQENNQITRLQMAQAAGVSVKTIGREMQKMPDRIAYAGSGNNGHWTICILLRNVRKTAPGKMLTKAGATERSLRWSLRKQWEEMIFNITIMRDGK